MNIDNVKLLEEDATKLRELNNHRIGMQGFIQSMIAAGEQRTATLVAEGQKVWQDLAAKYNLDVDHLSYELDQSGKNELKITGARFE